MSTTLQVKRRIAGAAGSPAAAGASEGELALNFPGAAGGATKPELWAFDGSAWRNANPSVAVTVGNVALAGGADIGAAWTALAVKPTDPIIVASYGGSAYIKTGAGGAAGDWAAMGSATAFASAGEIATGTDIAKAVNSLGLRGATVSAPTGGGGAVAGDADKIVRLDATGQIDIALVPVVPTVFADATEIAAGTDAAKALSSAILRGETLAGPSTAAANAVDADKIVRLDAAGQVDPKFLPVVPTKIRPAVDATAAMLAAAPAYTAGDIVFSTNAVPGVVGAGWTGAVGDAISSGDALLFDGTKWHVLPNTTDLNAYLALAGGSMSDASTITFADTTAAHVIIDGGIAANAVVDNVTIDGGTY
jgi:hypothetical protein